MFRSLYRLFVDNRELIFVLMKEELRRVNYGSLLGLFWLVINPLLQACIYIFVLGVVFPIRLGANSSSWDYAIYVVSGFMVWHVITTSLSSAPSLFITRAHLIRYVPYPIQMLPLPNMAVAVLGGGMMFLVYFIAATLTATLHWSLLLLPIPVVLLGLFIIGATWILMVLGVVIRDITEIVRLMFIVLLYPSPILFTPQTVGSEIWKWVLLNPFSHIIISFRDVAYGTWNPSSWMVFVSLSLGAFVVGAWTIQAARRSLQNYV